MCAKDKAEAAAWREKAEDMARQLERAQANIAFLEAKVELWFEINLRASRVGGP